VGGEKRSPLKAKKNIPPEQKLATDTAPPQSEKIAAEPNFLSESPKVRSYHPGAKKPSESGGFWLNALALAAISCLLSIAVVERSPSRRPAEANANEDSRSASEQSDSASEYSVPKGSPASMDAPIRPSKGTPKNSPGPRDFGSDKFDDVTVRKFPAEPVAPPGASTSAQDPKSIFFDLDSAAIAGRYRLALQQIADALAKDPEVRAILEGHTDDSGPEVYNLDLSNRRAIAVREALINDFIVPSTQLTAIGSGSAAPVQPNSSPDGRAYNRRVAVRFVRLGE
jgi:outer membrane protein OmpA-like peptidoglycan-associated protein